MQRLYVGGLSHTVTEKDLRDRFGKFGQVEDVELRTRRDDEGVPYKTFGYININISLADLKKCMTVLNKSKWKGGTLQIETAKESFLNKLAQERQVAAERQLQLPAAEDPRQKLLDSLSQAGVDNFTMKAAVPGTEIPGHKDWVVSKFGRVLPVLQIKCQNGSKARTLKYDPSKYSHNIRRLDKDASEHTTPVTKLTWEVHGGDDDISKKRRGEFPPFKPSRPKKIRTDVVKVQNNLSGERMESEPPTVSHSQTHLLTNGFNASASQQAPQKRKTHFTDSDIDSDEEIRRLATAPQTSHGALLQQAEEDNLEVVGYDFLSKSGYKGDKDEEDYDSADTDELFASRKPPAPQPEGKLASASNQNNTTVKQKTKRKSKAEAGEDAVEHVNTKKLCSVQPKGDLVKEKQTEKTSVFPGAQCSSSETDDDDDEDDDDEDDHDHDQEDSESDESDYESMFSDVTRLEISFEDLRKLGEVAQQSENAADLQPKPSTSSEQRAPKKGITPEEILAALMGGDHSDDERDKKKKKKKIASTPLPAFMGTKMLNEESEREEGPKEGKDGGSKTQKVNAEPTQHKQLTGETKMRDDCQKAVQKKTPESSEDEEEMKDNAVKKRTVLKTAQSKATVNRETTETSSSSSSQDEEEEEKEEDGQQRKVTQTASTLKSEAQSSSSSCSSPEKDKKEQKSSCATDALKAASSPALDSESSSSEEEEDEEEEEEEEEQRPTQVVLGAKEEEERQRKANLRRLAAVQQKQKEAEEHKKLIQGALAKLDAPAPGSGKHIVFNSDDDEDEEDDVADKQQTLSVTPTPKKTLLEDSQSEDEAPVNERNTAKERVHPKPSGHQLFGGSEDEEGSDEEEDGNRFDIRPQFEGPAGQKLMELQSRFGTDERFRMDSRFLEEDEDKAEDSDVKKSQTEEEEALEEERKKSLSILQGVLGSSQQTCSSKAPLKAKKFRDVAALHYDPSKEEHAAFETKTDESKKESKSARKKKREEALKLPEVSKEIYYDVSGDLKAVFGQTKDDITEGEESMNWDQVEEKEDEEEEEEEPAALSMELSAEPEKDNPSGFMFSFFGEDTEATSGETAEYKVESIQAPKVSWQQDPRFHDSSSGEEEEEEEEEEKEEEDKETSSTTLKNTKEETLVKTDSFFFHPNDNRLTEGPQLFWRASDLEEQKEEWEERRTALRQEYRKKHKDARRRITTSLKR
ncbi:unnamed protein product [Ophioblennius macclurei]